MCKLHEELAARMAEIPADDICARWDFAGDAWRVAWEAYDKLAKMCEESGTGLNIDWEKNREACHAWSVVKHWEREYWGYRKVRDAGLTAE